MTDELKIGSRREIFSFDGHGSGEWVPATMVEWSLTPAHDEIGYMVFLLDRPGPRGNREEIVKCTPSSVIAKMRPITRAQRELIYINVPPEAKLPTLIRERGLD